MGALLHQLDLSLCDLLRAECRFHAARDEQFAYFVLQGLPQPLSEWVRLRPDADLLLSHAELEWLTPEGLPAELLRPWRTGLPPYASPLPAVAEIRRVLSATHADGFAACFEQVREVLEAEPSIEVGAAALVGLISEVRRHIGAMGRHDLLPRPDGGFPTPSHPRSLPRRQPRQAAPRGGGVAWLSVDQIRRRVRVRREAVLAIMDAGDLRFETRGRARYARLSDVEAWEERRAAGAPTSSFAIDPALSGLA